MSDKDTTIKKIALAKLGLKTRETQRSDSKDFHELAVWNVKSALEAAYQAGYEAHAASGHLRLL